MSKLNDYLYNLAGKCRILLSKHHNYNVHMRINDCSIDVAQKEEFYVRTVNCPYSNFKQITVHN
jgi:hypothetical protein